MIGSNKMEFNHSTMQEAVAYWLNDKQFQGRAAIEVTAIRYLTAGNGAFKIDFKPVDKEGDTNDQP